MADISKGNPNSRRIIVCPECKKESEHHAKGVCYNCYRRLKWERKLVECKNCHKQKPHQAFGLCSNCHMKLHHYDIVKRYNTRKYHNISLELHKKITKECVLCSFNKAVDLHHLDGDHKNNDPSNLVGLCPNHHKMYHKPEYQSEVTALLKEKGYKSAY